MVSTMEEHFFHYDKKKENQFFLHFVESPHREDDKGQEEIASMPGVYRWGVSSLVKYLRELVGKGLRSVLLFGVVSNMPKVRLIFF